MELWIPFAKRYDQLKGKKEMPTKGLFPDGGPNGLIVHYSAGHDNAVATMDYGAGKGYTFLTLSKDGTLWQGHPLNKWGSHAGDALAHNNWGKQVSMHTVGVEIMSAGALKMKQDGTFWTYWGEMVPLENVREFHAEGDPADNRTQTSGYYEIFTEAQEATLIQLCMWLADNVPCFSIDNILGHDEVEWPAGRKSDPGGSLSLPMPLYRDHLKSLKGK